MMQKKSPFHSYNWRKPHCLVDVNVVAGVFWPHLQQSWARTVGTDGNNIDKIDCLEIMPSIATNVGLNRALNQLGK